MYYVGIDIGSTASKIVVIDQTKTQILDKKVMSSGWNMKETGKILYKWLEEKGYNKECKIVATGYGRVSVPFCDKTITEITCHAKGSEFLGGSNLTIIDIGGQDTKIIQLENGFVADFLMNDKCSAGTGKFLEIMANRLGLSLEEMFEYAKEGKNIKISSTCTVFAESEMISLMGQGVSKEDLANGVIQSIVLKVSNLAKKKSGKKEFFLTGGFSNNEYIIESLAKNLDAAVSSHPKGRFAGAIGAALLA